MKLTTNLKLKKPDLTDYVNVEDFNENADVLDAEVKALKDGSVAIGSLTTTSKTLQGAINELKAKDDSLSSQMADVEKQLNNYSSYASVKDSNGIYTVVDYKRKDGTLYMKSTLNNADLNGNYQTDTWKFYNLDGITLAKTVTWTITYDADGNIVSKVVA